MAIRIRTNENGEYIALCACVYEPREGDIYLNDGMHTALSEKFTKDFNEMGFLKEGFKI